LGKRTLVSDAQSLSARVKRSQARARLARLDAHERPKRRSLDVLQRDTAAVVLQGKGVCLDRHHAPGDPDALLLG
jgi:hypothetical protein